MAKRRGGAKRQRQANAGDVWEKKAMENGGGSREGEESRGLGTENGDPARGGFGDGPPQRHEGGNGSRKRRVRFAGDEEMEGDEGGRSRDEAVVPCEEGKVTEGTVDCVEYRSPMKLRSRDHGQKGKLMYDDIEGGGGFPKKRERIQKGKSKGGTVEVHETRDNKGKRTSAKKRAVENLDVAGKGTNTGKDGETVRERGLKNSKSSLQKKGRSQLMKTESNAEISKEAKEGTPNKHDPKVNTSVSPCVLFGFVRGATTYDVLFCGIDSTVVRRGVSNVPSMPEKR